MAIQTSTLTRPTTSAARRVARAGQATSSLAYDRLFVLLSAWLLGGLFVDGWAHINLPSLETFFTPWHGLFYSGFLAVLALLGVGIGRGRARGFAGLRAIPAGYELSALGAAVFMVGGLADMVWHILFGIEVNVEALLSPTHLMLATGLALILSGPARAAWRRAGAARVHDGWTAQLPMLLSLTYVLALFGFFTSYIHPTSSAWVSSIWEPLGAIVPTTGGQELEIPFLFQVPILAGTLVQSALLVGVVLLSVRRARLPLGSMTLFIGLTTVMLVLMRQRFVGDLRLPLVLSGLGAGVLADLALVWLRPTFARPLALQAFAALVPVLVSGAYFGALMLSGGVWWTIHLWAGIVFLAGVVGYLLALLVTAGPAPAASAALAEAPVAEPLAV